MPTVMSLPRALAAPRVASTTASNVGEPEEDNDKRKLLFLVTDDIMLECQTLTTGTVAAAIGTVKRGSDAARHRTRLPADAHVHTPPLVAERAHEVAARLATEISYDSWKTSRRTGAEPQSADLMVVVATNGGRRWTSRDVAHAHLAASTTHDVAPAPSSIDPTALDFHLFGTLHRKLRNVDGKRRMRGPQHAATQSPSTPLPTPSSSSGRRARRVRFGATTFLHTRPDGEQLSQTPRPVVSALRRPTFPPPRPPRARDVEAWQRANVSDELEPADRRRVFEVLEEYQDIITDDPKSIPLHHARGALLHIRLRPGVDPQDIRQPTRQHTPEERQLIEETRIELDKAGILEPTESPVNLQLVIVCKRGADGKPDGRKRIAVDMRPLNAAIVGDATPLPFIRDLVEMMSRGKFRSKLDGLGMFWSLPLSRESAYLTATAFNEVKRQWPVVPFGIKTAPPFLARFIAEILKELAAFARGYLDDVLMVHQSSAEVPRHLRMVMQKCWDAKITLSAKKMFIGYRTLLMLGYDVSENSWRPSHLRLDTLLKGTRPRTRAELRRFVNMARVYADHVPKLSGLIQPLRQWLGQMQSAREVNCAWDDKRASQYASVVEGLQGAVALQPYDPREGLLLVYVDFSQTAMSWVGHQRGKDNRERIVFVGSKTCSKDESVLCAPDGELQALRECVRREGHQLRRAYFLVVTDNEPNAYWDAKADARHNPRRMYTKVLLDGLFFGIIYRKGPLMAHADFWSRLPRGDDGGAILVQGQGFVSRNDYYLDVAASRRRTTLVAAAVQPAVAHSQSLREDVRRRLVEEQTADAVLQTWKAKASANGEVSLIDGVLYVQNRLAIPASRVAETVWELHLGHVAKERMANAAREVGVWWPDMARDIAEVSTRCPTCQFYRRHHTLDVSGRRQEMPTRKLEVWQVDVALPAQTPIMTAVDMATGFLVTERMTSRSAQSSFNAFERGVVTQFGVPRMVRTDRGSDYVSDEFRRALRELGVEHHEGAARDPNSQAMVERAHADLTRLMAVLAFDGDGDATLRRATAIYNQTPRSDVAISPWTLVYGQSVRRRMHNVVGDARPHGGEDDDEERQRLFDELDDARRQRHERGTAPLLRAFQLGDWVLLEHEFGNNKVARRQLWRGPYLVTEVSSGGFRLTLRAERSDGKVVEIRDVSRRRVTEYLDPHDYPLTAELIQRGLMSDKPSLRPSDERGTREPIVDEEESEDDGEREAPRRVVTRSVARQRAASRAASAVDENDEELSTIDGEPHPDPNEDLSTIDEEPDRNDDSAEEGESE
jgi:transposase InsO family protein